MPVITRSATGPSKKMVGVKRKFIEILDSDDDTTTVCTDSEFEQDSENENTGETTCLRESENALVEAIIQEREKNRALQTELTELKEKHDRMLNNIKEIRDSYWAEFVAFTAMLAITAGASLAAYFACSDENYEGFRF
jgi:hypothetical protein